MLTHLDCAGKRLTFQKPLIMGVLNCTPDSFSDGGKFIDPARAVAHALAMERDGAAIIDVGGESTRPGAQPVTEDEEIRRVVPIIEQLVPRLSIPVSIDTSKPGVMQAAVAAGAGLINDVYGFRQTGAVETAVALNVPVCVMHMQGEPRTMQQHPRYNNVVEDVYGFLAQRVERLCQGGMNRDAIMVDPGFGFGKTLQQNLLLLKYLDRFGELGLPLLVGLSRKSLLGKLLNVEVDERLPGSLALAMEALHGGANIIRVHDVKATVDAVEVWYAVQHAESVEKA